MKPLTKQIVLLIALVLLYWQPYTVAQDEDLEDDDSSSDESPVVSRGRSAPRMSNGIRVNSSTEYPFLYIVIDRDATAFQRKGCGGVLLSDRLVLTSARCVTKNREADQITRITVAATYYGGFDVDGEIEKMCWAYDLNDNFEPDVAVLRLRNKYPSNKPGKPVTLPTRQIRDGEQAYILGLGETGDLNDDSRLHSLPARRKPCAVYNPLWLCFQASDPNLQGDVCDRDEGGPVLVKDGSGYTIYGITSKVDKQCVKDKVSGYSLFSNVYHLMPEIRNQMEECNKPLSPTPPPLLPRSINLTKRVKSVSIPFSRTSSCIS